MVTAGLEHEKFINLFPSWQVNSAVQEVNCKVHDIVQLASVYTLPEHDVNHMKVLAVE